MPPGAGCGFLPAAIRPASPPRPNVLPLDHIRVLDLTRLAPGPHCTMILADLGADVIRVEEPGGGRRAEMERERMSEVERVAERRQAAFNALNRNKRSITLNLKLPEAKQA